MYSCVMKLYMYVCVRCFNLHTMVLNYWVLKRTDKHYTLEIANHHEVVLLDRLKLAFMECNLGSGIDELAPATTTAQPTYGTVPRTVTHSGQQVRRPVCFLLAVCYGHWGGCCGMTMKHHVPTGSNNSRDGAQSVYLANRLYTPHVGD